MASNGEYLCHIGGKAQQQQRRRLELRRELIAELEFFPKQSLESTTYLDDFIPSHFQLISALLPTKDLLSNALKQWRPPIPQLETS